MTLDKISQDPIKSLALGNSIPSEYDFYKYKQEGFNVTLTEQENILLLIMSYRFQIFDLSYLLDLEPNNIEIYSYYNSIKEAFNKLVELYETNYGSLSQTSRVKSPKYSYLNTPWDGIN